MPSFDVVSRTDLMEVDNAVTADWGWPGPSLRTPRPCGRPGGPAVPWQRSTPPG